MIGQKDLGRIDEAVDALKQFHGQVKELGERDGPRQDTKEQAKRTATAAETLINNYSDLKRIIEKDEDIAG